jgi:hypothetical protein
LALRGARLDHQRQLGQAADVDADPALDAGLVDGEVGKRLSSSSNGTLTFNGVSASTAGVYPVLIACCDGSGGDIGRSATITVNGVVVQTIVFTPTGSFSTQGTVTAYLPLNAGANTVELSDASAYAPDFNAITVSQ